MGDAAGRKNDHGDSDLMFAKALNLPFFNDKEFFMEKHGGQLAGGKLFKEDK